MPEPIVLNETLGQGIYVSEREMTDLNENKNSICNKFISIEFNKEDATRSKRQAIAEYLRDVVDNAKEYESAVYVQGIFTYENSVPVENWLLNSVENLKGHSIDLPTNWLDIAQLIYKQDWSLLYYLSMERIEAERIYTPTAAFKFWEQQDFKELLNEVMDKSAFFKFSPEEEKVQGIGYLMMEMFKIRRQINLLNMQPEIASKFFSQKWSKRLQDIESLKACAKSSALVLKRCSKNCRNEKVPTKLQRQ
jgi:hypothetical protein